MRKLPAEIKKAFNCIQLFPFATSSISGIPNVVPVKFVFIESDNEIWFVDNFMLKTLENMAQNPRASLYVYEKEKSICCQIKGTIRIQTSGENYDRMKKNVHTLLPEAPAKSLVILNITEIYQCIPGGDAGKRIH